MPKQNCWEVMKCGREDCPAMTSAGADGVHQGKNAGRACWAVTGTLCHGQVQGIFAAKLGLCMQCKFYQQVITEEGKDYQFANKILPLLYPPLETPSAA
jgi:hypothetical protein